MALRQFLPAVADHIVQTILHLARLRTINVRQAILHPHDGGDLPRQATDFAAVVIDDHHQVGLEIRACLRDGQRIGHFRVAALDHQFCLVAKPLECSKPVAWNIEGTSCSAM